VLEALVASNTWRVAVFGVALLLNKQKLSYCLLYVLASWMALESGVNGVVEDQK
jgi:hypothetical protein